MRCRFCNSLIESEDHHLLTRDESRKIAYKLLDVYNIISIAKNRKITAIALAHSIHKFGGKAGLCFRCHKKYHKLEKYDPKI